jgi:hypothetical protein
LCRNEVEEPRETSVEVIPAQPIQTPGSLVTLADQASLSQHSEVAALGGLAYRQREAHARRFAILPKAGEVGDDAHPHRVAERRHQGSEPQFIAVRVGEFGRRSAGHASQHTTMFRFTEHNDMFGLIEHDGGSMPLDRLAVTRRGQVPRQAPKAQLDNAKVDFDALHTSVATRGR